MRRECDRGIGADFVAATFGVPPIDVFPKTGSALIGAASSAHATPLDFNGTSRSGTSDAGAYRYLVESMERFASLPEFLESAGRAGFRDVKGELLFPGVCGLVTGVRA